MTVTRRTTMTLLGSVVAAGMGASTQSVRGATPPMPRMPLDEFVKQPDLVAALRKGVVAMKARKPSDPLSWFYQAAIHGVTEERLQEAAKNDPDVLKVDKAKYWNQCPHFGQNSANFLPWHRGYTYFFERVLRMHTGRDDFSLPYWNYISPSNRRFPEIYGIQYLDGNLDNDDPGNINPLWNEQRDFYFTTYQHPLTKNLPLLALTDEAVDISKPMNAPHFFGATETEGLGGGIADQNPGTRGLLESMPHDQIHRSVGGIIGSTAGDMAVPPTAGFDPIFSVHHTNIDWLWAQWACMPGKSWGALPPVAWFDEKPWYFFDEIGKEYNDPRRKYFDHRALGIRFQYEDANCNPLELPQMVATTSTGPTAPATPLVAMAQADSQIRAPATGRTAVSLAPQLKTALPAAIARLSALPAAAGSPGRLVLRLGDIEFRSRPRVGFDVHVTSNTQGRLDRSGKSYVGSINLFNHAHHGGAGVPQDFDVTEAVLQAGNENLGNLNLVFVPYPLLKVIETSQPYLASEPLTVRGVELLTRS